MNSRSEAFEARVFYELSRKGAVSLQFTGEMQEQDPEFLQSVYKSLQKIHRFHAFPSILQECLPCYATSGGQCAVLQGFDADFTSFFRNNPKEIVLQTKDFECRPGFVMQYNFVKFAGKCVLCPNHWENCYVSKTFNLTFCENCENPHKNPGKTGFSQFFAVFSPNPQ